MREEAISVDRAADPGGDDPDPDQIIREKRNLH